MWVWFSTRRGQCIWLCSFSAVAPQLREQVVSCFRSHRWSLIEDEGHRSLWWASRCGGFHRSSDSAWPGLRAAGGGRVLRFAPAHHILPMPASERACIPQGVEQSYLLLAGDNGRPLPDNSLKIPWPTLLCFALNLSLSKICSIYQCGLNFVWETA